MGFGDVKLAFLLGLYLGWPTGGGIEAFVMVVWAMLIGFGLGSVIGIGVLAVKGRSTPYPFGPFLVVGAVTVILVAPQLVADRTTLLF
jgi:leader peptidase (prepilin peptidase)/N-methyltransferase